MKIKVVFGGKCLESLAYYDQKLSVLKMCQISLKWGAVKSLEALPKSGTVQNGQLYRLQILGHHIKGPGGSVWAGLPTPTVAVSKNTLAGTSRWKRKSSLQVSLAKIQGLDQTTGKNFRLNPPFVEEMMGFPIGWTELEP